MIQSRESGRGGRKDLTVKVQYVHTDILPGTGIVALGPTPYSEYPFHLGPSLLERSQVL